MKSFDSGPPCREGDGGGGDIPERGWRLLDFRGSDQWPEHWPPVEYRREAEKLIRFRLMPAEAAVNQFDTLHGAFLAGLAENSLGLFLVGEGGDAPLVVTVSLSLDYAAPGRAGVMLEGELELIRDSYHLQFLRLMLMQDGSPILHGNGILKKLKSA